MIFFLHTGDTEGIGIQRAEEKMWWGRRETAGKTRERNKGLKVGKRNALSGNTAAGHSRPSVWQ